MKEIYKVGCYIKRTFIRKEMRRKKGDVEIFQVTRGIHPYNDSYCGNWCAVDGKIIRSPDEPRDLCVGFIIPKRDSSYQDRECSQEEAMLWMI